MNVRNISHLPRGGIRPNESQTMPSIKIRPVLHNPSLGRVTRGFTCPLRRSVPGKPRSHRLAPSPAPEELDCRR